MTSLTSDAARVGARRDVRVSAPWDADRARLALVAVAALVGSLWGLWRVGLDPIALVEGWPETRALLERMWPATLAAEDRGVITRAVFDTFFMAYAGTAIGVILAIPLAFLAAENVTRFAPIRLAARGIIVFTRAVPALVFGLVFVRVFGIGVLPGVLAIGLSSIGMLAKLMADAIEDIDPGQREGVVATGAGRLQEMVTGIWGQIVPTVISVSLYRLEIDFRSAPILGFVGAGGIGIIIRGYQGNLRYPELLGVALLIAVLVVVMEALSSMTRRAILGTEDGATRRSRARQEWDSSLGTGPRITAPWTKDRLRVHIAGWASLVLLVASFIIPDISFRAFVSSIAELPSIFWRLVPKDMTWFTDRVVADLIETVAMGFAATFLSLLVAVPLSFLAAHNTAPNSLVYRFTRLLALLVRAAPDLVVAVILVAAIGLGPAAGVLALTLGLIGFATKLLADNIEEVPNGPREGVFASGASRIQEVGTGVTPQVLPALLANMLYLLDISIRSSTVLGIVGAGGIGFLLNNAAKTLNFEVLGGIIFSIFVIVYSIELLSGWVRRRVI